MQESKDYILRNIKTLLNLDEAPYQLESGTTLDRFIQAQDQDSLMISCTPSQEFTVLKAGVSLPEDGHIIQISKIRSGSLANFYSISVKPASQFQYLSTYLNNVHEQVVSRMNDSSLFAVKELKAVLASNLRVKLLNEADLNFTTLEDEFDFWQEQDLETPSNRCSYFLKQYAPITKPWKSLENVSYGKLGSLIQVTWAVFSSIWNSEHNYHEKRFVKIQQIFETEIKNKIKLAFSRESDLLDMSFEIKQRIIQSIGYCKKFISLQEYYRKCSKRKMPASKLKKIEELQFHIMGTFRTKSKVEMLNRLYREKLLAEDPSSLVFLVKSDNFMGNYMALLKNNAKALQKLEEEKNKLELCCRSIKPLIESNLRESLKKQNITHLLKTLEKWFFFMNEAVVAEHTSELQQEGIKAILNYFENAWKVTAQKLGAGLETDKLRLIKSFRNKLREIDTLMQQFAQNSTSYPIYQSKVAELESSCNQRETKFIEEFKAKFEGGLTDKHSNSKLCGKMISVLSIDEQQGMAFEVDESNEVFILETKRMLEMKYADQFSERLLSCFQEAKRFHRENGFIKNLKLRYNNIEGKLQVFQRSMVKKELGEIRAIIENPPIANKRTDNCYEWRDLGEVQSFISKFDQIFQRFVQYLKVFNDSENQIQEIALDILSIQFVPHNFYVISQKLKQINRVMEAVSGNRDTQDWRQFWKVKITDIVGLIWKEALLKGISISMTVNSTLVAGSCTFQPPLSEIKQKYLKQVKSYVGWPCESTFLDGASILSREGQLIISLYRKVQAVFGDIDAHLADHSKFSRALQIDVDLLEDKINRDQMSNEALSEILQEIESTKSRIDRIPDQEKAGSINIDNTALKTGLMELADEKSAAVIQLIKYSVKVQSEQVEEYITNAMQKLDQKPNSMGQMSAALKEYEKLMVHQKQIQAKIKQIEARNSSVRSVTGLSFNTINMMKRWENFQTASAQMGHVLGEQKNRLQEDSIKKGEDIEKQVQKLYNKYQQIKPNSEGLNREQILQVYARIKDWYAQWEEVELKFNAVVQDITEFKMQMPDFEVYKETKTKLKHELGNWLMFMEYRNKVEVLEKEEWVTFRGSLYKYVDLVSEYTEKVKEVQHKDSASQFFKELLHDSQESIALLRCLTGQNFQKQHWGMLFSILKIKNVTSSDKLLFIDLLDADLSSKALEIRDLEARAKGELTIRDALGELEAWALTRQFQLTEYNSMGRITSLIKQWKDIITEVSDHQAMVASVRQSKYAARFKEEIQRYEQKFGLLDDALLKLNQIQRKWIYLEPIFMRGALPSEQGRWKRLDEEYRNIMNNVTSDPTVISLSAIPGFQDTLSNIIAQLERCQKALNDFLEQKRNKFPRFYFLGDDDLLEILGQSQNPAIIQLHLKKLFSGIHKVSFGQNNQHLLAMQSSLGQEVGLHKTIEVSEIVENWLQELNTNMVKTLQTLLAKIDQKAEDRFQVHASQIICLIHEIAFNQECSASIGRGKVKDMKSKYQEQLSSLTKKCHQASNPLVLAKIKSLILDLIHQISVLDLLIATNVKSLSDWNWYKQLRFNSSGDSVDIIMADATFSYSFQYQGNAQKLVYTPLTDKCYLTLTQAMKMGLGGNPYGPAGTGKTESVKALALAFGRQVLVFNCDQGLDFHSMGRIFIGLVKCGAWGCFDEFNRLLEEQLSAISQQIQIIQEAIKAQEKSINLLGKRIEVNFNSAIFVTLNPAGKGYGGRSKLPDNLKQLFRPIAMSVPDNELIAEVLLYAEGFRTAKLLARKIITIFTLSKQLLSRQLHYDWGLRALKTILTVAGRLIFEEKEELDQRKESEILIKSLRINTISKLTFADMLKFNILVKDVFPGIDIKDIIYEKISGAVQQVFQEEKYNLLPSQSDKILQFYEATKQRIGAVLVGPSGCGKTTIWKTLKRAYEILEQPVKVHLINPKSMPRVKFLGHMNNDTREFSEGVLTASAREVIKEEADTLCWIICDGDVDPEWIQALNSVLDDNHLLTLPTGERISFGSNINFIFETDNLQFASPATVSRMGMIFMNEEDININGIISKWAKSLPAAKDFIVSQIAMIEESCDKVYAINDRQVVDTTKVGLVRNALSLLHTSNDEQEFKLNLVKGLASNFTEESRSQIFEMVYGKSVPGGRDPLSLKMRNGKISEYKDLTQQGIHKIYLTKSLLKDIDIVSTWLRGNQHVIIVGKEGCGKSLLLEASIQQIEKHEKCKVVTIHCNRQTKSEQLIQKMFQTCQRATSATGKMLKPSNCGKQIFLFKEVNLPKPDKYNTIEMITFIQSLITHEGFYDHNLQFVRISEGIQFVCIMKPSSTIGRFELTTRFVSNLRILRVDYGSVGTKQKLCEMTPHGSKIDDLMQQFWHLVEKNFKSDDNSHYLFTPRNLNGIVNHLQTYQIDFNCEQQVLQALHYEVNKQFGDRLVDAQSKRKFQQLITPLFGREQPNFYVDGSRLKPCSRSEYVEILKSAIKQYEKEVKPINAILVDEVIDLMGSIEKTIVDRGHLLLAGSSGSLRKTSVRVLTHKNKVSLSVLSNIRNPSLKEFYKDLKSILEMAGGHNKPVLLFLEEQQLGKNIFYEKINSLISSGEIPGLFSTEEIQGIVADPEELRSEYYGKNLYESFVERVKKNLMIVLSFDHRNKEFYEICSANPAFYSFCRIIWLNCYQAQSLRLIGEQGVQELNLQETAQIIEGFIKLHKGSSLKYLTLIDNFLNTYSKLKSKSGNRLDKLRMGLEKLSETARVVDQLTANAIKTEKLLTKKQKEASISLNQITEAMQEASSSKAQKEELEIFLSTEEKKIQKDKQQVEVQLKRVQPLIEEAKTAVSGLSKKNIEDIKAFMNPPETVRQVLKAVLRIFGNKDESWNSMKNFLKVCKQKILYFEIKDLRENVRREVQTILDQHAYSFERENVFKASQSAVPLADWVKAVVEYSRTYQKIRPLQENLNKIERELSVSRRRKAECTQKIAEADIKQKRLNEDFMLKKNEAEQLKKQLVKVKSAMKNGKNLLEKLEGEKERWEIDSDRLTKDVNMLPRSTALTAAFITYLSASPENVRHRLTEQWKAVFECSDYNFLNFVTNEAMTLQEVSIGLPSDRLSIENSQILALQKKTPLIIDPYTQATSWLKGKVGREGTIQTLTQQDPKFINTLQLSVRFGKVLVLQEIDFVQPILTSILKKDYIQQGPRSLIQIGQKLIDVNETFKFFMTTRNSLIEIPYHQSDLLSIVNFSVTRSGLEGKLLSLIISHFQPELEKEKQNLLETQEKLKISLSDLQQSLLKELAGSSGNILENKQLINSLNQTKQQSATVSTSLKESEILQTQLDQKRQIFMPISEIGAKIYISLSVLVKLNPMYKYNLSQFIGLFTESLQAGEGVSSQIDSIRQALIKIVYDNVSIGLLKGHRLLLGLIIIKQAIDNAILDSEYNVLIDNVAPAALKNIPRWVEEGDRQGFANFMSILGKPIDFHSDKWAQWVKLAECEQQIPKNADLTPFQETILVSTCRPDRLMSALNHFVMRTLGITNLTGIDINMKTITSHKMKNKVPCLFIVSVGFDPSKQIQEHALKTVGKNKFEEMSMGGDQNQSALQLLKEAAQEGKWLCLKNLHLVLGFVTILEKELLSMEPHPDFRLFLTTEAREKFPPILLQTCYKVSYEAPPGLKKNFSRIMSSQNMDKHSNPLHLLITFFQALVQERRNYIPQGWTKFYEFNYGDYKSGLSLSSKVGEGSHINWVMLYGLMLDTIYGGRIENDVDMRILDAQIREYLNEQTVSGRKSLVKGLTVNNILDFDKILPDEDTPNMYGLPNGIESAVLRLKSKQAIQNLKIVSTGIVENTKFSRQIWHTNLSPVLSLWKGLLQNVSERDMRKIREEDLKSVDPINSFIFGEAYEAGKNYKAIEHSLEALQKVLTGNSILTSELQEMGHILLRGEVPPRWRKIWQGPDIVTEWLKMFMKKLMSLQKWVGLADRKQVLSQDLDLSQVFRPQIFFNALKQTVAREKSIPVDQLQIKCSFSSSGEISARLRNLILEGCSRSGNAISDSSNDQEFQEIPTLYVYYNQQENSTGEYKIPFYTDSSRAILLAMLPIKMEGKATQKVLAGAAIMGRN